MQTYRKTAGKSRPIGKKRTELAAAMEKTLSGRVYVIWIVMEKICCFYCTDRTGKQMLWEWFDAFAFTPPFICVHPSLISRSYCNRSHCYYGGPDNDNCSDIWCAFVGVIETADQNVLDATEFRELDFQRLDGVHHWVLATWILAIWSGKHKLCCRGTLVPQGLLAINSPPHIVL